MEAPAAGMDFGHSDLRPSWCAMTPWTRSRENIHSLTHLGGELKTQWQRGTEEGGVLEPSSSPSTYTWAHFFSPRV
jgi:hypothetical protein